MIASEVRRKEIVDALRRGTVPRRGIEMLATGLDRFVTAIDEDLDTAARGGGAFKAVRGEYGCGKTFFSRWVQHRAIEKDFAVAEVQISETETPLHRMETIYRRAVESLRTREWEDGAFRSLVERWFYDLEEEVLARPGFPADDAAAVASAVGELLETRLSKISAGQPMFAAVLRAVHAARMSGDASTADGLLAWLMGQPNVGAAVKRVAGVKGEIDTHTAAGFLRGLLSVLAQTGRRGLVLVLDEVETVQRMRGDVREKSLNALRQLIDEVQGGRYPGLYVVITGTPAFYDGPQGVKRLPPLEQRLYVHFAQPEFDNPKAVQIRLLAFDAARMLEVGRKVRDLFPANHPERMAAKVDDGVLAAVATEVSGKLGGKVGIAPRLFLKKLVVELLDRVDQFETYEPKTHYRVEIAAAEMNPEERAAAGIERTANDITLDISSERDA
jgi:hypothetical protein